MKAFIRTGVVRTLLLTSFLLMAPACDVTSGEGGDHDRRPATGDLSLGAITWGCEHAIPSAVEQLDPRWRQTSTMVGDLGFPGTVNLDSAWRRHRRADLELKLPIVIEGQSGATVWIPRQERHRVAMILSDVPRRGPGNSYRLEDGYSAVRFEPCVDRQWSAWTAGLALVDRREVSLRVRMDGAPRATTVILGG